MPLPSALSTERNVQFNSDSANTTQESVLEDGLPPRPFLRSSLSDSFLRLQGMEGGITIVPEYEEEAEDGREEKEASVIAVENYTDDVPTTTVTRKLHHQNFYVCPSNTIIASNGDVYHVEPFQLPPPNEIANLFQELRKYKPRTESNLSDLDLKDKGNRNKPQEKEELLYGAHERPGAKLRKRFSLDYSIPESKTYPPLPEQWVQRSPRHSNIDPEANEENGRDRKSSDAPSSFDSEDCSSVKSSPSKPNSRKIGLPPRPKEPSLVSEEVDLDMSNFSIFRYLHSEIFGIGEPGHLEPDAVGNISNFLHVPYKVEELIEFGFFICLDSFLFVLTILPIRLVYSLVLLAHDAILLAMNGFQALESRVFHRTHAYDVMRGMALLFGCYTLHWLNMSIVYHFIRGQNMIKLYVLTGMMEIFNNLFGSFGRPVLGYLSSHVNCL